MQQGVVMGLLDSVIGALGQGGGGNGGGGQAELVSAVIGMLGNNAGGLGGLAGLVSQFQQGGLGDIVQSWVSTGQNLPVSPEQLGGVLGNDRLGQLAQQLGMPQGDVAGQLSQILPQLVDRLTPNGQLPAGGGLGDVGGLGDLGGLLGSLMKR